MTGDECEPSSAAWSPTPARFSPDAGLALRAADPCSYLCTLRRARPHGLARSATPTPNRRVLLWRQRGLLGFAVGAQGRLPVAGPPVGLDRPLSRLADRKQ
jgi:hypothetical protein